MKSLHNLFESILQEKFSFAQIATRLTQKKFKEMGITLNKRQLKVVEKHFEEQNDGLLTLDISDYQLKKSKISKSGEQKQNIKLEFTNDELDKHLNEMNQKIEEITPQIVNKIAEFLFKKLKKNPNAPIKQYKQKIVSFEKNIREIWGRPLVMLRAFITIALEAGSEFNENFRKQCNKVNIHKYEVLIRSHARACLIASEVHTLLCKGYADGAHARWRSIHEIATIVLFIANNDDDLAERYLLHDGIESYKAAKLYRTYYQKLHCKPISKKEFNNLERVYNDLLEMYGPNYRYDYGWASKALGKTNPTFRDIEEKVGLDYLRPYYKLASHNVHANPKGVLFKLGLFKNKHDILLAGPSNIGFTDPAHGTAISLLQITISLLLTEPDMDNLVTCTLLMRLEREIGDCFFDAQTNIIKSLKNRDI